MTVKLTERDRKLLAKCALSRWLTTTQLARLYFPTASVNAVQKRLRKLADAGYLRTHREHPTAEIIHALGPKGKPLVEELGIAASLPGEVPKQVEHLIGINEVRVAVETGGAGVRYFFAHWQLADLGWTAAVIPDAVFAFTGEGRENLVLEYDRGTEPLGVLVRKLEFYDAGIEGFPIAIAVLVTETGRRTDLLGDAMRDRALRLKVLAAPLEEVSRAGTDAVYVNVATGTRVPLIIKEPSS
jgi:hypothetical protein